MREDYQPLDDMRASAAYRLDAAIALVAKALAEIAGTSSNDTRVFGRRADAHIA
jgi:xanthine dehydrogenase small subunit